MTMQKRTIRLCWALSLLVSLIAVLVMGFIWRVVHHYERPVDKMNASKSYHTSSKRIDNQSDLEAELLKKDTHEFSDQAPPLQIPIGFFIQSFDFIDSNEVNITGWLWLKFLSPEALDLFCTLESDQQMIVFPEEIDSGDTVFRRIYWVGPGCEDRPAMTAGDQSETTMGWYFDVNVRQQFDYSTYPLDYHSVWLRVVLGNYHSWKKVLLVPDFSAYPIGETDKTKRIRFYTDEDLVSGGWKVDEIYFNYHNHNYQTTFGIPFRQIGQPWFDLKSKELYFNIAIQRIFRNAFIINLIPLFIVALLLFSQIMTVTGDEKQADRFGFTTTGIIGTCSALFFVVMLSHIQVRREFAGSGLVYIEYFYLIMYVVILLTALNSYVFSIGRLKHVNIIHYHDNFIPKVIFWPSILWLMVAVTVFDFWEVLFSNG
jgi:hypothetical protein